MQPKLADVAKLAGVSITTVSRVINDRGYLSSDTKEKVFSAMQQLSYQPSLAARALHGKQFKLVGLIFASLENPLIAEVVEEIENRLFNRGYKAIICNSMDNPEKEQQYLKMLMANQVDGIITGSHNEGIKEYRLSGLPIVSYDRYFQNKIPTVSSDNLAGGELAATTMIEKGSTNLMLVSGSLEKKAPNNARLTGFKTAAKNRKVPVNTVEFPFNSTPTIKRATIREKLVSHQPDGVFCTDDLTALLCIQEAQKLGLKVPEDIQVIGYDGSKYVQEYNPELSTIVQPVSDIADLLVRLLFNRLEKNDEKLLDTYVLPIKLLQRGSTRK
ncbi:LacI family DNA-binding transcriptional regulator [Lentilactobacillus hilgardii]|uniref:LacI family DNA-binding transcriptional regulator n=1 Tax=Lentilactobacillus hilgardii TaxID=1588 RepID=UPI0021C3D942|nr:LacI family DNA-binding transcriptional regulator [Lentilactobacillus hilgardii]MCP9332903.1 LacI family DNA-binding transcriptional regulator [Lentilactobacillus hilgardii]MCP9349512.1 LacI family DNA-binding transcriptional regulator [Lentilactobacillus hilgardii]MCP9352380.1 LacI family DNA-binding transcriptional regulator [Lentilactobacillus hilgardii]